MAFSKASYRLNLYEYIYIQLRRHCRWLDFRKENPDNSVGNIPELYAVETHASSVIYPRVCCIRLTHIWHIRKESKRGNQEIESLEHRGNNVSCGLGVPTKALNKQTKARSWGWGQCILWKLHFAFICLCIFYIVFEFVNKGLGGNPVKKLFLLAGNPLRGQPN